MEKIGILKSKRTKLPKNETKNTLNSNFWFVNKGQAYIFKYSLNEEYDFRSFFNEVFIAEMCKYVGINCQSVSLAIFTPQNVAGVKIKSFLNNGDSEIHLSTLLDEKICNILDEQFGKNFVENKIMPYIPDTHAEAEKICSSGPTIVEKLNPINNKIPTLIAKDDILRASENRVHLLLDIYAIRNSPAVQNLIDEETVNIICNKITALKKISIFIASQWRFATLRGLIHEYALNNGLNVSPHLDDDLIKMLIFDYAVMQSDRHLGNISVIQNGNSLRLAPLYDNGHCLMYGRRLFPTKNLPTPYNQITQDILRTETARTMLKKLKHFVEHDFLDYKQHLINTVPELYDFAPVECKADCNHNIGNHTSALAQLQSKLGIKRANEQTNALLQNDELPEFKGELTPEQIQYTLIANTPWLENHGIKYSKQLWLEAYISACKSIISERVDELITMQKDLVKEL